MAVWVSRERVQLAGAYRIRLRVFPDPQAASERGYLSSSVTAYSLSLSLSLYSLCKRRELGRPPTRQPTIPRPTQSVPQNQPKPKSLAVPLTAKNGVNAHSEGTQVTAYGATDCIYRVTGQDATQERERN